MSYKCGYCHGRHTRPETGKQCALEAQWRKRAQGTVAVPDTILETKPTALIPGCYKTGDNYAVRVTVMRSGRWKNRYFVNVIKFSTDEESAVFDKSERDDILEILTDSDWSEAMLEYGKHTGICPICGQDLKGFEVGIHGVYGPYGLECTNTYMQAKEKNNGSGS